MRCGRRGGAAARREAAERGGASDSASAAADEPALARVVDLEMRNIGPCVILPADPIDHDPELAVVGRAQRRSRGLQTVDASFRRDGLAACRGLGRHSGRDGRPCTA